MLYGSLCSGIGGLDRAIERVLSARPAWFCEADKHATQVLARHWPGVPILPDVKTQDWTQVEPVELISAGYPCQPFSQAGRRRGTDDPRHLWPFVIDAVRVLRPRLVVLENVSGHLGLGFDAVLCDLAEAGFDAEWTVVPASAAGACHRRERLFVVAHDTTREPGIIEHGERLHASRDAASDHGRDDREPHGNGPRRGPWPLGESGGNPDAAPNPNGAGCEARDRRPRPGHAGRLQPVVCGVTASADADDQRFQRGGLHGDGGPDLRTVVAHSYGVTGTPTEPEHRRCGAMDEPSQVERAERLPRVAWGDYVGAIERWEHVLGRPAPRPIDEKGRLSVPFVEWMMGFDAGWVDGLNRSPALRALGNAVVQQQGELAITALMDRVASGYRESSRHRDLGPAAPTDSTLP